ncbi:MAG TPA: hypothetical protein VHV32_01090 [Candidatus Angelobacter sp.]|nr:hypothetical protein [Candidatus Angelobacter sp.]
MEDSQKPVVKDMAPVGAEQQEEKRIAFEQQQEDKRQKFEQKLEEGKTKRDWMMLIITFAAVAAAYWTGWVAQRARTEARESATKSFESQLANMQLDERPYLKPVFQKVRLFGKDKTSAAITVDQTLTAYGRTPALNILIVAKCGLEKIPITFESIPKQEDAFDESIRFPLLAPGETSNKFGCSLDMPSKSHSSISYFGTVFYEDMFNKTHIIQFCWTIFYDFKTNTTVSAWPCQNVSLKVT